MRGAKIVGALTRDICITLKKREIGLKASRIMGYRNSEDRQVYPSGAKVNKIAGYLAIIFLSSYAYAAGGTGSIGTVSARGDVRVDGYTVSSNGTVFDGSIIETSQFTATLRLNNGDEISLDRNSQGVMHRDRMELLRGRGQLKATAAPFLVEAEGLRIASYGTDATGIVSVSPVNTIDVAALSGEFRVMDGDGFSLGRVSSAGAMSFPVPKAAASQGSAQNGSSYSTTVVGIVSAKGGHYYIELADDSIYELVGGDPVKYVGDKVVAEGTLQTASASGTPQFIVKKMSINGGNNRDLKGPILVGSAIAGGAAAIAFTVYEGTRGSASR